MNSSRLLWGSVGITALIATLLFAAGFVYAIKDILYPAPAQLILAPLDNPVKHELFEGGKIQIVSLGDSLTKGTGDLTGKGYVGRVKEQLEKSMNKPVYVLANYSVNGYKTNQLLHDILTKSEVPVSIAKADLIMLTIGGNDLFSFNTEAGNLIEVGEVVLNPAEAMEKMSQALRNLEQILARIAELNPHASILYVGLYHPFKDFDSSAEMSLVVEQWNHHAFAIANAYPNMIVVPTYDLFEINLLKYLYTDHFHPNQDGYQRIADRIMQVLE